MASRAAEVSAGRLQVEALRVAEGYFASHVLFALNELEVFDRLTERPRSARELATLVRAQPEPLERLLNAGVAAGLLRLEDGAYANTELSRAVLVRGENAYLGNWMRWLSRLAEGFTRLPEAVRTGSPAIDSARFLGRDEAFTRDFILAMDDYARLRGSEIVRHLELDGEHLVDVGGGSGSYSILFAERWPDVRASVFDLPEVVEIANERITAAGVADRVETVAGDYHRDELGEGYDVVFISDVLHQETPEDAQEIVRKGYRALRPGGRIVVQGMFLNEDRTGPRWPVMQSLILLLTFGGGRAYTVGETMRLLERAGFRDLEHRRMSLLNVNSLILGRRD